MTMLKALPLLNSTGSRKFPSCSKLVLPGVLSFCDVCPVFQLRVCDPVEKNNPPSSDYWFKCYSPTLTRSSLKVYRITHIVFGLNVWSTEETLNGVHPYIDTQQTI